MSTTATHAQSGNGKVPPPVQSEPEETTTPPAAPEALKATKPSMSWLGRRRNFLVSPRQTLPGAILATAATLILVILLNVNLQQSTEWNTRIFLKEFPDLAQEVHRATAARSMLMYALSVILVAGVFAFSVVRTHRTVGPLVRIMGCMKAVQNGDLGARITLRRHDNLLEVADAFNTMMDTLEQRTRHQMSTLELCIRALETSGSHQTGRDVAKTLREVLEDGRESAEA